MNIVNLCYKQKDDKQPLLVHPAQHNKVSPHPDDEAPEFKIEIDVSLAGSFFLWQTLNLLFALLEYVFFIQNHFVCVFIHIYRMLTSSCYWMRYGTKCDQCCFYFSRVNLCCEVIFQHGTIILEWNVNWYFLLIRLNWIDDSSLVSDISVTVIFYYFNVVIPIWVWQHKTHEKVFI